VIGHFARKMVRASRHFLKAQRPASFALNSLDVKLASYLRMKRGFFIEAGAHDGVTQSNTLYFERYLGWRGLLIEPIPELWEKCRRNRPNAIVEQCALVSCDYPDREINMQYCNLMSLVRGARGSDEADAAHIDWGLTFLEGCAVPYRISVRACNLSNLLDRHNIKNIDLLSLDVEGYEVQALLGLDMKRHRPTYILVEANQPNEVNGVLRPYYHRVACLSDHDFLYQSVSPIQS
jgi:FkbM family methyltransferase